MAERRPEFPRFYRGIIALRRAHPALRRGETEWLKNSDESRVLTYSRRDAEEEIVVAINFSNQPFLGLVETRTGAPFTDITPDTSAPLAPDAPTSERAARTPQVALPVLSLDAWGYRIFVRQK
jgi:glycosidase